MTCAQSAISDSKLLLLMTDEGSHPPPMENVTPSSSPALGLLDYRTAPRMPLFRLCSYSTRTRFLLCSNQHRQTREETTVAGLGDDPAMTGEEETPARWTRRRRDSRLAPHAFPCCCLTTSR